jgi:cysteine synthase
MFIREDIIKKNYRDQREAFERRLTNGLSPLFELPEYFPLSYVEDESLARDTRILALPLFEGFGNGKDIPAFQILLDIEQETKGNFPEWLVVPSSGNTVAAIAHKVPWFGGKGVVAFVDQVVPWGKIGQVHRANDNVRIVRVPTGMSTIECARKFAEEHGYYFVDQYTAPGSVNGHIRWTWPHVAKQLRALEVTPSFVCVALGTTSSFVSAHYLKNLWPDLEIVGTACDPQAFIPGARTVAKLKATGFGYAALIGDSDRLVLCDQVSADRMGDELYRHASFSAGPTTAMAGEASFRFINRRGRSLARGNQKVVGVILAMDAAAPYYADRVQG